MMHKISQQSISLLIHEAGHWVSVALCVIYLVGFYLRWEYTYRISTGHFWVGGITFMLTALVIVIYAFYPAFAQFFWPLLLSITAIWVWFNNWYVTKWKVAVTPVDIRHVKNRKLRVLLSPHKLNTLWFGDRFRMGSLIAGLLIGGFWAFSRTADQIAVGDKRLADAVSSTTSTVSNAVYKVEKKVTATMKQAVDTLHKGQRDIARDAKDAKAVALQTAVTSTQRYTALSQKIEAVGTKVGKQQRVIVVQPVAPTGSIPQPLKAGRKTSNLEFNDLVGLDYELY